VSRQFQSGRCDIGHRFWVIKSVVYSAIITKSLFPFWKPIVGRFPLAQVLALTVEWILTIGFHCFTFSRHRGGYRYIVLWIWGRKHGYGSLQKRTRWRGSGYRFIPLGLLRMYVSVVFALGVCNVPKDQIVRSNKSAVN